MLNFSSINVSSDTLKIFLIVLIIVTVILAVAFITYLKNNHLKKENIDLRKQNQNLKQKKQGVI